MVVIVGRGSPVARVEVRVCGPFRSGVMNAVVGAVMCVGEYGSGVFDVSW